MEGKNTMKKALAWLLVIAMTAALAVGGTLAYLTDTDEDVNVMTVGKVKIDQLEYERVDTETNGDDATVQEFHNNKPLYPAVIKDGFDWDTTDGVVDWEQIGKENYTSGIWNPQNINNELDKMVFVKNKGDWDAYVRTVFAFEAGNYETLADYLAAVHLNLNETDWTWEWSEPPVEIGGGKYFIATATYNKVLEPGALTEISLSQIALDPSVTNDDIAGFGDTFQVLVQSQAVQADGFEDADSALTEAFGALIFDETEDGQPPFEVDPDDIPFEGDSPVSGTDLRTALHNLNGNTANPITTKVTNVIYALNEEYPEIVDTYEPTLVDVEQDVKVNAYYVPNGSYYDVYFLANAEIYSPADSTKLYAGMSALKTVDTHNFDVSRVTNAYQMFMRCSVLTDMDVSEWDTSSITDMTGMFYQCYALPSLEGINNWDVSSCTTLFAAFYDCDSLTELDLSGWDVGNVVNLDRAISKCDKLQTVDLTDWNVTSACNASSMLGANGSLETVIATGMDVSGITNGNSMFAQNTKLTSVVGSENWTFNNLTTATWMFENCSSLTEVEVGTWGFENLKEGNGLFSGCSKLKSVNGSGNWDLSNAVHLEYLFQNDGALTYVDATNWGLENCVSLQLAFRECGALETVEGTENWDTSNVENFYGTFYYNRKLADIDVSKWDTSSAKNLGQMFNRCVSLEVLDIANWDVSNVTDFSYFLKGTGNTGDIKIKVLDVSKWNPVNATSFMCTFYGCAQITEMDMSGWVMPNLESVSHMFADCYKLEKVDFTGWETPKLNTVDALFNNCGSLKSVDVSDLDTANVVEFSQVFEYCYSLVEIIGLDKWDTTSAQDFGEMFSGCSSLKELDLSSFNSTNARDSYVNPSNGDGNDRFNYFLTGCNSLEKITLGEKFSFDGDGSFTKWTFAMPSATNVQGWDGHWYNAETGAAYLPSEIPEETAATYVAVKPSANP